jgi:hypothetical protein
MVRKMAHTGMGGVKEILERKEAKQVGAFARARRHRHREASFLETLYPVKQCRSLNGAALLSTAPVSGVVQLALETLLAGVSLAAQNTEA